MRDEEVPRFTGAKKMSLHQTGFQEVLSAADLLGRYPARLALIGCQPLDLEDWGGPLTAPARAAIDPALSAALRVLSEWGASLAGRARRRTRARRGCWPMTSTITPMRDARRPASRMKWETSHASWV